MCHKCYDTVVVPRQSKLNTIIKINFKTASVVAAPWFVQHFQWPYIMSLSPGISAPVDNRIPSHY